MVNFKKTNVWAKIAYILAIVTAVVFIYMIVASFSYMAQSAAQYGATIGLVYGFKGIVQTLVTSTYQYLVYAALLWIGGLLLNKVLGDKPEKKAAEPAVMEKVQAEQVPAIPEDVEVSRELSTQWKRQFKQW